MSIFQAVIASISSGAILTAGSDGGSNVGYSNGGGPSTFNGTYGSLSITTESHGYTVDGIADIGLSGILLFAIEGNHTGATFTALIINGTSFTRASATSPNGTFDAGSGSTFWSWSSTYGFVNGNSYTVNITP